MSVSRVAAISMSRRMATVSRPRLQQLGSVRPISAVARPRLQPAVPVVVNRSNYSTAVSADLPPGVSKLYKSADEAVADIKSGSTILSAGFGLCGVAGIAFYYYHCIYYDYFPQMLTSYRNYHPGNASSRT